MTVNYTTNLSLGQPVTGTESGTWGDDVNNSVTSYLDIAIAGGLAITITTTDVTLSITQGTSSATNIGSTTAQYAILNVSGAMTAARNLILPSSSRIYLINNNTTGGFALTVKGSATSGVTMVNGEKAHIFWNGTDYAKVGSTAGAATFTSITNTGLTSGRVVYSTTGGLETDSANLTFNGTTLTANTIGAFTLSGTIAGGGNQINNVIIGTSTPLAGAFTSLSATTTFTRTATTQAWLDGSMTSGTWIVGGTAQTGAITLGRSTGAQTLNLATGATTAGTTKAINIGTAGVSTSITNITLGSSTAGALVTHTWNAGSNNMTLNSSGNLAIGGSTPTSNPKLSLYGGIRFLSTETAAATYTGIGSLASDTVSISTSGSERMFVDTNGNVAIGGTIPASNPKLSLFGGIRFMSTEAASSTYTGIGAIVSDNVCISTAGTEKMRIDNSGNVGIGTSSPDSSAILDAQSTTKGVRMPNMTTTQKNAISSPAAGLMVFDTTLAKLCVYSGSAWQTITSV